MSKFDRTIVLLCPTCGNDELFEENSWFTCTDCGLEISAEDLIQENGELIEATADNITEEVIKDFTDTFKKMFK